MSEHKTKRFRDRAAKQAKAQPEPTEPISVATPEAAESAFGVPLGTGLGDVIRRADAPPVVVKLPEEPTP
jgi:hypothetical protein